MTDKTRPVSSWIAFQWHCLKYGYPKWEGLVLLAVFVLGVVLALTYADPGSIRLALRDWLGAVWAKVFG